MIYWLLIQLGIHKRWKLVKFHVNGQKSTVTLSGDEKDLEVVLCLRGFINDGYSLVKGTLPKEIPSSHTD